MNRTTMALAMGSLALAGINASAATLTNFNGRLADVQALTGYNHLTNVNGVGATQNSYDFLDSRIGLNDATSGTQVGRGNQYHHIFTNLEQAPGGSTGTITASDYPMMDTHYPAALHVDPITGDLIDPTYYDLSAYGVGQMSWCMNGACTGGLGTSVGHNQLSHHILFSLSRPSAVTINISSAAADLSGAKHGPNETEGTLGGDLIPGFTLYSGVSTTGSNDANHAMQNQTSPGWTNLTYMDHDGNSANTHSITWNSEAEGLGLLPAGFYSIWLGSTYANVPNADGSHGKNYALSISAAPVPVPATFWLLGSALAGLGWLRRRMN